MKKKSSIIFQDSNEEIINELKDENRDLQKTIEILKKKIFQGFTLNSKDMEFNEALMFRNFFIY